MTTGSKKKATTRQLWAAALYAARLVLRLKPRLFVAGLFDELFTRTVPFIEAALLARVITRLPELADAAGRETALQAILWSLGLILLVQVVQRLEASLYDYYSQRQEIDLNARINRGLIEKFARLPYARYEEKGLMDQYDLAREYSQNISNFVLYRMRGILGAVYTVVIAAVAIIHVSPMLAVVMAIVAVPQLVLELRVNRQQRENWRDTATIRRKATTFESLFEPYNIKDSRLFGLVGYALDQAFRYGKKSQEDQLAIDRRVEKYRVTLQVLETATQIGALAYVVRLIYVGAQPIGQFVFVQQVLDRYMSGLSQVVWAVQELDDYLAGATEFHAFMRLPERQTGEPVAAGGDIVMQGVSFTYPGAQRPVLRDVSLTIPAGSTVAFVGENGAGKTTLVKLLMKLYDPSKGTVQIGDQDLSGVDEDGWHDRLGVLFQDFTTFTDFTVRENVTFGRLSRGADEAAVTKALKQAGAYGFVRDLPNGPDTYLGKYMDEENGTLLSGGQLQRLAIARVLFRDPDILIMDEPTSAVDAKAEYEIFRELEQARRGRTTILISHRFSTVRKADYIFVLDKGRIAEQGTHDALIAGGGRYAELFNAQAEGYR